MKILVVDDEKIVLDGLVKTVKEVVPNASIYGFNKSTEALEFVKDNKIDIAFLDIEMGALNGIEFAKEIKMIYPTINIIFVTGYSEYAIEAFRLKASGYLLKPFTKEDIQKEIDDLRNNNLTHYKDKLTIQCFGEFKVFYNHKEINFERNKTKELFAYLVYKRGEEVRTKELKEFLFSEDVKESSKGNYLQKLKADLKITLKKINMNEVFITGWSTYSIDPNKINCDYYDFLDNKPNGIRAYNGKFMSQYSWAQMSIKD